MSVALIAKSGLASFGIYATLPPGMMAGADEEEWIMNTEIHSAIDYYERHPISFEIILAKLNTS